MQHRRFRISVIEAFVVSSVLGACCWHFIVVGDRWFGLEFCLSGIIFGTVVSLSLIITRIFLPHDRREGIIWWSSNVVVPSDLPQDMLVEINRLGEDPALFEQLARSQGLDVARTVLKTVAPLEKLRWNEQIGQVLLGVLLIAGVVPTLVILAVIGHIIFDQYKHIRVAHLESLGARVQFGKSDVTLEIPRNQDVTMFLKEATSDLRHLSRFDYLNLDLSQSRVSDADIEQLGMVWRLSSLNLAGTDITDRTLEQFKGSTTLYNLNLDGTKITDAGLSHLNGITQLAVLSLARTQITADGLQHLKGLQHLCSLCLSDTRVTDTGLKRLKDLPNLRHLDVRSTRITDRGTGWFQWTHLECEIIK
jgi:hypothetical protein